MHLHTKKQELYYDEVIRLHREYGYGEGRISKILPIGHATISRWIAIFVAENKEISVRMKKQKPHRVPPVANTEDKDMKSLQSEIIRLQAELQRASLRADAYEEMIDVAESKFNISIRKKVGVKR
jgi:dsDNA-binding SOS-regulon protein